MAATLNYKQIKISEQGWLTTTYVTLKLIHYILLTSTSQFKTIKIHKTNFVSWFFRKYWVDDIVNKTLSSFQH